MAALSLTMLALNQGGYDWGQLVYAVGFGGSIGTYQQWREARIHRYLAEFDFRYPTKDITAGNVPTKSLSASPGSA